MVDALMVGRFMFGRQAEEYGADPALVEDVWKEDAQLRLFWSEEAQALLDFLGYAKAER